VNGEAVRGRRCPLAVLDREVEVEVLLLLLKAAGL
jgi:hypothetical protein